MNSIRIQEYTPHKIILDIVPHKRSKAGSRDSKKNLNQRKIR